MRIRSLRETLSITAHPADVESIITKVVGAEILISITGQPIRIVYLTDLEASGVIRKVIQVARPLSTMIKIQIIVLRIGYTIRITATAVLHNPRNL